MWSADDLVGPGVDAPALLAAAAAATEGLAVGLGVAAGRRAPAWTAKHITTLDAFAPGRLVLGVDLVTAPQTPDSDLDLLLHLLLGESTATPDAPPGQAPSGLRPALGAPPPLLLGGPPESGRRRAARHGATWIADGLSPAAIAEGSRADTPASPSGVLLRVADAPPAGPGADSGRLPYRIDAAVQRLDEYIAAGVETFLFAPSRGDEASAYERLAEILIDVPAAHGRAR